jgi:hypothetical protein
MPGEMTFARGSRKSYRFSVLLLSSILIASDPGASTKASEATEPTKHAAHSVLIIGSGVDSATIALSPDTAPRWPSPGHALEPHAGKILKEIGKQTIDQPGHFLIAAAPIWASRYLVGVPWYGWVITPLLAYREWLQWPSNRWWDPPLDWAFLSLGTVVATWRRRSTRRVLDGLRPFRRPIAR